MSSLALTGRTSRWRRLVLNGTTLCVLAGVAVGAGLRVAGAEARPVELTPGVPTMVSPAQLARYATESGHTLYWLGPIGGRRLEVTETGANGLFVRYLPAGDASASTKGLVLTVATYPVKGAYRIAVSSGRAADAVTRNVASGGIAVWRRSKPTNMYVAYPDSDLLVEIFDPDRVVARSLGRAGRVRPVA